MTRPACVVIDRHAARANLRRVRELVPQQKVVGVIKADAYGHGLIRMASALSGADAFGVACLEEARVLRAAGIHHPIVLLEGAFSPEEMTEVQALGLDIVVHHEDQVRMVECLPIGRAIRVWVKVDTGMHRLGFIPERVESIWARLSDCTRVAKPLRLMTHLACAHDSSDPFVAEQLDYFHRYVPPQAEFSIANSAAILAWPKTHADWVRPGLMLYGVSPFDEGIGVDLGLKPVMTLRSELIAVKMVKAGETVGYGRTWQCPEDMPVGVVAMGYGDGYPRHAESGTPVLINGQRGMLIGRPSMDMLTVDLRACPDAEVGDPVILWGEGLPVEEIARWAKTIPYELLCSVRVRARYLDKL